MALSPGCLLTAGCLSCVGVSGCWAGQGDGAASCGSGIGGSGVGCSCAGAGTTNGSEPGVGPGSRGAPGGGAAAGPDTAACRPARTAVHRRAAHPGRESVRARARRQVADARRLGHRAGDRQVVGVAREADAGIGPPVHAGAPSGVGDQLAHRPVLVDVGQRTAARLAAGSALGADDRQVVRDSGTGRHRGSAAPASRINDRPLPPGAVVTAVVQQRTWRRPAGRCTPGCTSSAGSSSARAR